MGNMRMVNAGHVKSIQTTFIMVDVTCHACAEEYYYAVNGEPECQDCAENTPYKHANGKCWACEEDSDYFYNGRCNVCREAEFEHQDESCHECAEEFYYPVNGEPECQDCAENTPYK